MYMYLGTCTSPSEQTGIRPVRSQRALLPASRTGRVCMCLENKRSTSTVYCGLGIRDYGTMGRGSPCRSSTGQHPTLRCREYLEMGGAGWDLFRSEGPETRVSRVVALHRRRCCCVLGILGGHAHCPEPLSTTVGTLLSTRYDRGISCDLVLGVAQRSRACPGSQCTWVAASRGWLAHQAGRRGGEQTDTDTLDLALPACGRCRLARPAHA